MFIASAGALLSALALQFYCSWTLSIRGQGDKMWKRCNLCSRFEAWGDGICIPGQFIPVSRCYNHFPEGDPDCGHQWSEQPIPRKTIPLNSEVFNSSFDGGLSQSHFDHLRRCRTIVVASLVLLGLSLCSGTYAVSVLITKRKEARTKDCTLSTEGAPSVEK